MNLVYLRLTLSIYLVFGALNAGAENTAVSDEFKIKIQYEKERIEDFYTRLIQLERLDAQRLKGEGEMRKERVAITSEYEASRREFVKQRKMNPPEDPTLYEREIKERAKMYELARKDYVQRRDEMQKALRKVGKIPEADEFDFTLYTDEAANH